MKGVVLGCLLAIGGMLYAYEITSIEFSDRAREFPAEKRVVLGKVTDRLPQSVDVIHALVHLKGVGAHDPITIRWIAEDALPRPDTVLGEVEGELDPHTKIFHTFFEQGPKRLPPGHYRLELLDRGKVVGSKRFTIVGAEGENAQKSTLPSFSEITLSRKVERLPDGSFRSEGVSDRFDPSQHEIFLLYTYKGAEIGAPYRIVWSVVESGETRNFILLSQDQRYRHRDGVYVTSVKSEGDWPKGLYEVEIRAAGKRIAHERFTIGTPAIAPGGEKRGVSLPPLKEREAMIHHLAEKMLQSLEAKTFQPIYDEASEIWKKQMSLQALNQSFAGIFQAKMPWREIFAQAPRMMEPKIEKGAVLILRAVYPGVHSVDVLLEGDYVRENGEWRLFGIALEPVTP